MPHLWSQHYVVFFFCGEEHSCISFFYFKRTHILLTKASSICLWGKSLELSEPHLGNRRNWSKNITLKVVYFCFEMGLICKICFSFSLRKNRNLSISEQSWFCVNSQHFPSRNSVPTCIILLRKLGFAYLGASVIK